MNMAKYLMDFYMRIIPTNFLHSLDPFYPNRFNTKLYYQLVGPDGDFVVGNDIAKFDVTKELKNLKMPVLVVAGRYDRVSVPKMAVFISNIAHRPSL